jgi:hypothetical protein
MKISSISTSFDRSSEDVLVPPWRRWLASWPSDGRGGRYPKRHDASAGGVSPAVKFSKIEPRMNLSYVGTVVFYRVDMDRPTKLDFGIGA